MTTISSIPFPSPAKTWTKDSKPFLPPEERLNSKRLHHGEADGMIELRDIVGQVQKIRRDEVTEEQHLPGSAMPPGLDNDLSLEEFNALIKYLG